MTRHFFASRLNWAPGNQAGMYFTEMKKKATASRDSQSTPAIERSDADVLEYTHATVRSPRHTRTRT